MDFTRGAPHNHQHAVSNQRTPAFDLWLGSDAVVAVVMRLAAGCVIRTTGYSGGVGSTMEGAGPLVGHRSVHTRKTLALSSAHSKMAAPIYRAKLRLARGHTDTPAGVLVLSACVHCGDAFAASRASIEHSK
jgi:hypothetical protein